MGLGNTQQASACPTLIELKLQSRYGKDDFREFDRRTYAAVN